MHNLKLTICAVDLCQIYVALRFSESSSEDSSICVMNANRIHAHLASHSNWLGWVTDYDYLESSLDINFP